MTASYFAEESVLPGFNVLINIALHSTASDEYGLPYLTALLWKSAATWVLLLLTLIGFRKSAS